MVRDHFASLPAEQFPNITGLASEMFDASDDERFEFGLDVLLHGLAAYTKSTLGRRQPPNVPRRS